MPAFNPAVSKTKTVRFAKVAAESGKPELVWLWGEPNTSFLAAVKQDRIMSVRQEAVGNKKDFGIVGFFPGRNTSYLQFPKSLAQFKEARIIGLNYDLLSGEGKVAGEAKPTRRTRKTPEASPSRKKR